MHMSTLGERLIQARTRKKWSRQQLSLATEVTVSQIGMLERGERGNSPRGVVSGTLPAIAKALGVEYDWLATGEGDMLSDMQAEEEFFDYLDNDPRAKITHPTLPRKKPQAPAEPAQAAINTIAPDVQVLMRVLDALPPEQREKAANAALAVLVQHLPRAVPSTQEQAPGVTPASIPG